jgi:rSAM/selenodomain-associated transferase 1
VTALGSRAGRCAIAVMAKAPVPGRAKTRLCPPLAPVQAAALSAAFLRDVTENIASAARHAPIDGWIAYAPAEQEALFEEHIATGTQLLLADGQVPMPPGVAGFGRALFHAAEALLAMGYGAVCLLNSDSPTLPTSCLIAAAEALLLPGRRAVLGPASDGGYYLLGLQMPEAHLFRDIAWSTERVAAETRTRAATIGLPLAELAMWYDVDDWLALDRLLGELDADADGHGFAAPATARCLDRLGLRAQPAPAV